MNGRKGSETSLCPAIRGQGEAHQRVPRRVYKLIYGESGRLVVVLDKCISGLSHEKNVLLRTIIKIGILKVHDAKNTCHCVDFARLYKMRETTRYLIMILPTLM